MREMSDIGIRASLYKDPEDKSIEELALRLENNYIYNAAQFWYAFLTVRFRILVFDAGG